MWGPYADILESIRAGMDRTELMAKHGWEPIKAALNAAEATAEGKEFQWVRHLEEIASMEEAAKKLERVVKKLHAGEPVSSADLMGVASKLDANELDFVPFGEVVPLENPWISTFFPPWDDHIGGYPYGGMTIIAGPAGLGKTTLLLDLLRCATDRSKRVAFFSMEMVLGLAAMRAMEISPDWSIESRNRVVSTDVIGNVDEIFAKCVRLKAQYPDLYMIGIDYADKLIEREQSEAEMGHIYDQVSKLAKFIETPVVLIAGVSRAYVGGEPMVNHIRYSGRAEHDSSLIILTVNPDLLAVDMGANRKGTLPYHPGMGYLKVGKSRFGTKEGGLGAIQLEWLTDRNGKWGDSSFGWHPLQWSA